MQKIMTIGLDLAKSVFQVHAASADSSMVLNRKLRRSELLAFFAKLQPCLVGMEACGSAHHWAREIRTLGHDVRLMPPAYVKPFVKRGKTDAADAEAIAEAVTRKAMRFVPVKSTEQQAMAVLVKSRALLVRQRTQAINALRAHLAEFGIIAGTGMTKVAELIAIARDESDQRLPAVARQALREIAQQVESLAGQIKRLDRQIVLLSRQDSDTRRLTTLPGVGAIIAASVKAFVPDPAGFKSGRHFAAWLGLTPRPHSSGGKKGRGASPRWAIPCCAPCWWSARHQCCAMPGTIRTHRNGSRRSWRAGPTGWSPLHWPTRWHASSGRCWSRAASIALLPPRRPDRE